MSWRTCWWTLKFAIVFSRRIYEETSLFLQIYSDDTLEITVSYHYNKEEFTSFFEGWRYEVITHLSIEQEKEDEDRSDESEDTEPTPISVPADIG